ncbi:olfactory receptor 10A3 [Acanthochromis polyacanthus]|uniref:olfactory receptor 10A3 n=1 Tax=Acanthochromis polyacanthus TaxID=80966 RepID=UPI0022347D15|nr:olfactory receptor 10A3 [Acanthochromis polyacanthus]
MRSSETHKANAGASMPTSAETHNFTDCPSEENLTEPPLDAASCLFLAILPNDQTVPPLVCVFLLLTLVSLLVNFPTWLALARSEQLSRQPRFTFMKNQILCNLIKSATFGTAVIHSLVQRRTMPFSTWCHIQCFIRLTTWFNNRLTIICMALERYLFVCHTIHYLVIFTETCMRKVLTFIWISSITISVITMVLLHTGEAQSSGPVTMGLLCEPNMMEQHMGFPRAFAIFHTVMSFWMLELYLFTFVFSYYWMYQDPSNAVIPFNEDNKKARKTVLIDSCMFLMELLPVLLQVISDALWAFRSPEAMTGRSSQAGDVCTVKPTPGEATAAVLHVPLLMMLMVPPCVNPLVNWLTNVKVRQALLSLFR